MNDFFTGIMLQNYGIYTLYGSKPIVEVVLYYYTDEEKRLFLEQMSEKDKITIHYSKDYHLAENWEKWIKIRDRFPMNRYLLFQKTSTDNNPKCDFVYFVDILKLAVILQKYYEIFRYKTDMDFDPIIEALAIEKGSEFWDKVDKTCDSILTGILFGYGLENSFVFKWKWWPDPVFEQNAVSWQFKCSDYVRQGEATLNNLPIPPFISFFDMNPTIAQYNKEKTQIQMIYKSKNFLDQTLKKLTE